jgi:hypothetical protein
LLRLLIIASALAAPTAVAAQDVLTPAAGDQSMPATADEAAAAPLAAAEPIVVPAYEEEPTLSVGLGLSTFGITLTPQARVTDYVGFRAPIGFFDLSDTFDVEGNKVDGSAKSAQGAVLLDYYPMGGGFRVSAGVGIGGFEVEGRGDSLTVTDTATNTDYTLNAEYSATVDQENGVAPMVAIGFSSPRESRVQLSFDLGVKYASYGLNLNTSNLAQLPNYDQTDIDELIRDFDSEADNYPFTPYVHFSLAVRF